jgi:hypothetical protein
MAAASLSLRQAAAHVGRSYSWLQRAWRTTPGFPPPYVGGGPGERPLWHVSALDAWMANGGGSTTFDNAQPHAAPAPANDPAPLPIAPAGRVARLLAAAGGAAR